MTEAPTDALEQAPAFRVVHGDPTDEELVALAAVIGAFRRGRGRPHAPVNPNIAGGWKSYWHLTRTQLVNIPGAWRSTARR